MDNHKDELYPKPSDIPLDELEALHTPTEDNSPFGEERDVVAGEVYKSIAGVEPSFDLPAYMDKNKPKKITTAEKPRPHINFIDWNKEPEPVDWLVEGWIAKRDIVLFAGRAKCGKSTTAAELAVAMAGGKNGEGWLGLQPKINCPVLYLDEEAGPDEIHRQFKRQGGAKLPGMFVSSSQQLRLDDPYSIDCIEAEIREKEIGLIVLDTASHFFMGADENNAPEVARRFLPLMHFRNDYPLSIVMIHHMRKPPLQGTVDPVDAIRGSTSYTTQASAIWTITPSAGGNCADLQAHNRRGGGNQQRMIRIEYAQRDGLTILTALGEPERVETTLDLCSRFIINSMQTDDREYWKRKDMIHHGEKNGYDERTIDRSLKHLVAVGSTTKVGVGLYALPTFSSPRNEALFDPDSDT